MMFELHRPTAVFFLDKSKDNKKALSDLNTLAAEEPHFSFITADSTSKHGKELIKELHLESTVFPFLVSTFNFLQEKFEEGNNDVFNGPFTKEKMSTFLKSVLSKKEESGKYSAGQEAVILTKSNWDSIVIDETKFVFVKFWAPWCAACQMVLFSLTLA